MTAGDARYAIVAVAILIATAIAARIITHYALVHGVLQ